MFIKSIYFPFIFRCKRENRKKVIVIVVLLRICCDLLRLFCSSVAFYFRSMFVVCVSVYLYVAWIGVCVALIQPKKNINLTCYQIITIL